MDNLEQQLATNTRREHAASLQHAQTLAKARRAAPRRQAHAFARSALCDAHSTKRHPFSTFRFHSFSSSLRDSEGSNGTVIRPLPVSVCAQVAAERDQAVRDKAAAVSKAAQSVVEVRRKEKEKEKLEEKARGRSPTLVPPSPVASPRRFLSSVRYLCRSLPLSLGRLDDCCPDCWAWFSSLRSTMPLVRS